ncbi:MAG: polyribonucleotide nucleotidyltransferase [Actinomycetota bacterium]
MQHSVTADIGGKTITFETGKLAKQASGAVTVRCGDSLVLTTIVGGEEPKTPLGFFPLTVDVEERMYAAGKIPGGFLKREGRPSETAVLTARMIDRPMRPSFAEGFSANVHVIATVLSADMTNPPDVLAMIGASAAACLSDLPFKGPLAAIKLGLVDGNVVFNPTYEELAKSTIDVIVAGSKENIMMVEGEAAEVPEEELLRALGEARPILSTLIDAQEELRQAAGVTKRELKPVPLDEAVYTEISDYVRNDIVKAMTITDRKERRAALDGIKEASKEKFADIIEEKSREFKVALYDAEKKEMRRRIIDEGIRADGRRPDEIRPISAEAMILPRAHGSGLFTRGETQVLTACTLGAIGEVQKLDGLGIDSSKRFIHHYNFPPFSTGEAGFMRGPKRRDIGHGALVESAIFPVIPDEETFPFTIRLVSEVLESNGSSSMASVCASTLALMDAGVAIKGPVAGIAMGLVKEGNKEAILTDIMGSEDFLGDMDFKIAGTQNGITAWQMDVKIAGISHETIEQALKQANEARMFILEKIIEVLPEPRQELSQYAPRLIIIQVPTDKIREIIGPGGKVIRGITEETGASIDIEDDGRVFITARDVASGELAQEMINKIIAPPPPVNIGEEFVGPVVTVAPFGAFVELMPGRDGLIHISKLARHRIGKVEEVVNVGDKVHVKVVNVDERGKISLVPVDVDHLKAE